MQLSSERPWFNPQYELLQDTARPLRDLVPTAQMAPGQTLHGTCLWSLRVRPQAGSHRPAHPLASPAPFPLLSPYDSALRQTRPRALVTAPEGQLPNPPSVCFLFCKDKDTAWVKVRRACGAHGSPAWQQLLPLRQVSGALLPHPRSACRTAPRPLASLGETFSRRLVLCTRALSDLACAPRGPGAAPSA